MAFTRSAVRSRSAPPTKSRVYRWAGCRENWRGYHLGTKSALRLLLGTGSGRMDSDLAYAHGHKCRVVILPIALSPCDGRPSASEWFAVAFNRRSRRGTNSKRAVMEAGESRPSSGFVAAMTGATPVSPRSGTSRWQVAHSCAGCR